MNDTTDGHEATAPHFEQSVYHALGVRNRVLGILAIAGLLTATAWVAFKRQYDTLGNHTDRQLTHQWTVDINQATAEELQLIPGLGPKLIEAILRHRDELGGFQSLDQLADIPGIKAQRVRVLTRYLRLSQTPDSNQTSPPSQ